MHEFTIQQEFDLACQFHHAGRLHEAEQMYRKILQKEPGHADALHHLGAIAHQSGRNAIAVQLIQRSLGLNADSPEAHHNLALALKGLGELDASILAFRQALALNPNLFQAQCNLGNALRGKGRSDEAIAEYRLALARGPNYAEAHNGLGAALQSKGQLNEAIVAYRKAIALRPDFSEAWANLGDALRETAQLDAAVDACRQSIAVDARSAIAYRNLGNILKDHGQLDEAIVAYQTAMTLQPAWADSYSNLGAAMKDMGQLDKAVSIFRKALAIDPDNASIDSNLIFTLHYDSAYDPEAIAEEHLRWNRQHGEPLRKYRQTHSNDRTAERRLRIGYVSPDFREHVVARYLLPLLLHHNHEEFEITCYAQVACPDAITRQCEQNVDRWRNVTGVGDEQMASQIRRDQIDILVDLSGHTANNRLLVFARKAAPVQVSYLGYPGSTGLSAIDYRLTDNFADPPELTDRFPSERLHRLPQTNWCFAEPPGSVELAPLPAVGRGYVTFGSFNNFSKVTEPMLRLWGRILLETPASRLLLKATALRCPGLCRRVRETIAGQGIDISRVDLRGPARGHANHLAVYNEVDIALDTFPYHGTTTTCEALWMGVPVVTLAGSTHASRVGVSLLSNVGLPELVAASPGQYAQIAIKLAKDWNRLKTLRGGMRHQMRSSPLMDAPQFARDVQAAYRRLWRTWCESGSGEAIGAASR